MDREWEITVWGVRGSAPAPLREFMEYGGNTACVSLKRGKHMVVFDAGTGLTALGREWKWSRQKEMRLDIVISHLHIDHVIGLFSFQPFFCPNVKIYLHGGIGLEQGLRRLLSPPWWPIGIQDFRAELHFHEIRPGDSFALDDFMVSTMEGNHPDGSILYRLEGDEKRLVYALDCEADRETSARLSDFAYGSNLLIWDANFTAEDFIEGWGHSTWEQGIQTGHDAAAGRVLMMHYGQEYTDEFLHNQEKIACEDSICLFAKEGMEIRL